MGALEQTSIVANTDDQSLAQVIGLGRKLRTCVITPDLVGPVRNGGIGTHCSNLLKSLTQSPYHERPTVLFTGPYELGSPISMRARYQEQGIDYRCIGEILGELPIFNSMPDFFLRAYAVDQFLRKHSFDVVHFQDWRAAGFVAIQSKRAGIAHSSTRFVVTVHSPSAWVREGMRELPRHTIEALQLDHMEQYCISHADDVVFPSQAMKRWVSERGWLLPALRGQHAPRTKVLPYPFFPDLNDLGSASKSAPEVGHLAFFGRLETRKGLELFVAAVDALLSDPAHGITTISLLGKYGSILNPTSGQSEHAGTFVSDFRARAECAGIQFFVKTEMDTHTALRYIAEQRPIVVCPSLLDNLPFSVIECASRGFPILATRVGGIPEIIGLEATFEPTVHALTVALKERATRAASATLQYHQASVSESWANLFAPLETIDQSDQALIKKRMVSVCVLAEAVDESVLRAVEAEIASGLSLELILGRRTSSSDITDVDRTCQGIIAVPIDSKSCVASAMNKLAESAQGDALLFLNEIRDCTPNFCATVAQAFAMSGAAALSCYRQGSSGNRPFAITPLGGPIVAGFMYNPFGDHAVCVARDLFESIGGFRSDLPALLSPMRELLTRVALGGSEIAVIPDVLVTQRRTGFSEREHANDDSSLREIVALYQAAPPELLAPLVRDVTVPLAQELGRIQREFVDITAPQLLAMSEHLQRLQHEMRFLLRVARQCVRRTYWILREWLR